MKSRLADIDQPLMPDPAAREAERQIKREIADHRRQTIRGRDPRAKDKAPWKMLDPRPGANDERPPAPPRFRVELDENNSIARLVQISAAPLPSMDSHEKWTGRKFRARITEACSVPEGSLPAGATVEAFAQCTFDLVAAGKGEILEEFAADPTTA